MTRFVSASCLLLFVLLTLAMPVASHAQISVGLSIRIGPPPLPVYVQPPCPQDGYIWSPGYWAYGPDGYYWVPGTWVQPPRVGVLWTPGYWGWRDGFYVWNGGYWGPHVGFYGGINYGFGYTGAGFAGGFWSGGVYNYNRSVTSVNVTNIHNTYNTTVINNNTTVNRVSYNGGAGGTVSRPTAAEQTAAREQHLQPTTEQMQHEHVASTNPAQLASANHGQPSVAASPKPGVFHGEGVQAANKNANFNNRNVANNGSARFGNNNPNSPNTLAGKGNGSNNAIKGNNPGSNPNTKTPQNNVRANNSYANNVHANNSYKNAKVTQNNAGGNNPHANNTNVKSHAKKSPAHVRNVAAPKNNSQKADNRERH